MGTQLGRFAKGAIFAGQHWWDLGKQRRDRRTCGIQQYWSLSTKQLLLFSSKAAWVFTKKGWEAEVSTEPPADALSPDCHNPKTLVHWKRQAGSICSPSTGQVAMRNSNRVTVPKTPLAKCHQEAVTPCVSEAHPTLAACHRASQRVCKHTRIVLV